MKSISPDSSVQTADPRRGGFTIPETAMVFAAGLGTRMRPLTNAIPKPLVSVAGRTLLDRNLDALAEAGVKTAIVNVHHLADQIEAHVLRRRRPRIVISDERERLLDQGGGIKKVLSMFGGNPFFICNTDAFWVGAGGSNLEILARIWNDDAMDAALLLAPTEGSVGVDWNGDFDLDSEGRIVKHIGEDKAPYVYAGVGIIKPQLFEHIQEEAFRLAPFFFDAAKQGRLFGARSDSLWCHVGSIAAVKAAERATAAGAD
jgi:MurNAc alpha-1-phosphate uridylyltransferase